MLKPRNTIKYSILILSVFTVSACSSFGYYMDLMAGHSELLERRKPINEILANEETTLKLRELLETSQKMRDFASKELDLPENDSYRTYADINRSYAVWNVIASKEFSIQAKKWCFLFVGCLSYRGYFSKADATAYANELKSEGYDVYVAGAKAYSTLGWFDDPLLNTMMYKSEARRAGIIFHELAHQVLYIDNDSAFNEAFATAVEQEGIRRWMKKKGRSDQYKKYLANKKRDAQLNALLQQTQAELKQLYKTKSTENEKRQQKNIIFSLMQKKYQQLKKSWGGNKMYDKWMSQELNNAHLVLIATYHELVPVFKAILKKENDNLKKFYLVVAEYGKLDVKQRTQQLNKFKQLLEKEK
jgi:predicted aminopeptidase